MKVLCIGNAAYDITYPMEHYPIENTKYKVCYTIECGGGTCSNSAYLLSKWGLDVYFAGIVGNDEYGKKIGDEFKEVGVKTDYLEVRDNYKTTLSHIIVNKENGSRTIISVHQEEDTMNYIDVDINPDIILIDGREYEVAKNVLSKYPNSISIIDASNNNEDVKKLCSLCDYVVCSKNFMKEVSGIDLDDLDNLALAFKALENMFNKNIIVTLEEIGCAYRNDLNNIEIIPSIDVDVVDTTGAGDIFHGAFTYGIIKKWPMSKILRFSNVAGAMSVTKYGGRNSIFSLEEVEKKYNEVK